MSESEIVQLRVDPENRKVFEKGVAVTFVRLALGEDGVFEIEVKGDGSNPFPNPHKLPAVRLA